MTLAEVITQYTAKEDLLAHAKDLGVPGVTKRNKAVSIAEKIISFYGEEDAEDDPLIAAAIEAFNAEKDSEDTEAVPEPEPAPEPEIKPAPAPAKAEAKESAPLPHDMYPKGMRVRDDKRVYLGGGSFKTFKRGHYFGAGTVTYAKRKFLKEQGLSLDDE